MQEERAGQALSEEHSLDELAKGLANGAVQRRQDTVPGAAIDGRRVRMSVFLLGLWVLFVLALGACGAGGGGGRVPTTGPPPSGAPGASEDERRGG